MRKKFNITGNCVASSNFMVDTSHKLESIFDLIERGKYFTINRPRQFGKTTTISLLNKKLAQNPEYLSLKISFEAGGDKAFESIENLSQLILKLILKKLKDTHLITLTKKYLESIHDIQGLSNYITALATEAQRKVVLIIDEVDRASNYQVFLSFLALLRDKYLEQRNEEDLSFQSVILVGVTDIKHLKNKIRNDEQNTINSPWNIAADFKVDLSFSVPDIETMLTRYADETGNTMNISKIAERIYYYTSGYPFLVSAMCKHIDEEVLPNRENKNWTLVDVDASFKWFVRPAYTNTLFDEIEKNIFNNPSLKRLITDLTINGNQKEFSLRNQHISLAAMYGILSADANGLCKIHNLIFEKVIYDFIMEYLENEALEEMNTLKNLQAHGFYENLDGTLDFRRALLAYQSFMKEHFSDREVAFLESQGRLLFLSFLKPILNGKGFDFKEPVVGDEKRIDIAITYLSHRYVIELKVWRGDAYHQKGLQQLSEYLDLYDLKEGFLLIYDFRKNKTYQQEDITVGDKKIFTVWV